MSISRRDALRLMGTSLPLAALPPALAAESAAAPTVIPAADDWPWWRGPSFNGHAAGDPPPLRWSETENVLWKTAIPGRGHATPCIWGERIFLAAADEQKEVQSLVCLARGDGQIEWQRQIHAGGFPEKHAKNSHASATPACDGERVFTVYLCHGSVWASAVDFGGEMLWQKKVGDYDERYGYGSSPAVYGRTLLVAGDSKAEGFLAALDRATGEEIWRAERPKLPSYGAPIIADVAGRKQVLVQGNRVAGYDPATGRQYWHCEAPARATACSLCFDDERVYSSGGYPERRVYAIRADGTGDVAASHIAWKFERRSAATYVPTPLLSQGRLFVVSDGGLATCLSAADGRELWSERLGGGFSASPTLIGDRLLASNEEGRTFVFKAADKFELLAESLLEEGIFASPVVCGGRLYLRTTGHLYCIGT